MASCIFIFLCLAGSFASASASDAISFRSDIAPILLDNCLACHGVKKSEGGYRVDSYNELLKPGDSGETPIAQTQDETSELLRRIACEDASERMPAEADALSPEQIELIKQWIQNGAPFDGESTALPLRLVMPPPTYADAPDSYSRAVPITAVVFAPDGNQIVAGGYHEVTVWSSDDHSLLRRIGNIGQRVFALAFSADGKTLAVACGDPGKSGEVRMVDFVTGNIRGVVGRINDVTLDVAFRPGTTELAVASADALLRIIDTETLQEVRTIASHADWVTAIAWSDDGSLLASSSRDKSAKVYDGETGELLSSYLGHGAAVRGVAILKDGKQVVSSGTDGKLHRWNVDSAKKIAEIGIGKEGYKLVRHGDDIFVPCADHRVLRIDLTNNSIAQEFKGHKDWVLAASLSRTTADANHTIVTRLLSGSFDGEVRLWNAADGSPLQAWIAKP